MILGRRSQSDTDLMRARASVWLAWRELRSARRRGDMLAIGLAEEALNATLDRLYLILERSQRNDSHV